MRIIRHLLPAFTLLLLSSALCAQSYKTAVGVRIDNGVQFTAQQYLFNQWTAEGILHSSIGSQNLGLTLLAERHHKILARGLNVYLGAGGHYYWDNESVTATEADIPHNVYGLSFIGGAEISLGRFNLALDWKPELHLSGNGNTFGWNGAALSVRYILAKREKNKIKDWEVWDKFGGNKNKGNEKSKKKNNKYD